LGRIGRGYVYPEFRTRFSYATPNINGFKAEVGMFDPQEPTGSSVFQTDIPKFEGEISYATTFSNAGSLLAWGEGTWQEMTDKTTGFDKNVTSWGVGGGAEIGYMGFAVTGYYYTGDALGIALKNLGGRSTPGSVIPNTSLVAANGVNCGTFTVGNNTCETAGNDGFYVQGAYSFGQGTKVAASYGESNQDGKTANAGIVNVFNKINNSMWTVGVYHDLTPWLKLVAEYNNGTTKVDSATADLTQTKTDFDVFSAGAFMTW
jgi:hypothetical protein